MLCCIGPWSDPASAYNDQTGSGGISAYPGQRQFVATGGNALAAADAGQSVRGEQRTTS